MSEKKHSPAPWTEGETPDGCWWEYSSIESEGTRIAAVMDLPYSEIDPEANLNLVLTAPELLEACEAALEWMEIEKKDMQLTDPSGERDLEFLRATIAKAKGES